MNNDSLNKNIILLSKIVHFGHWLSISLLRVLFCFYDIVLNYISNFILMSYLRLPLIWRLWNWLMFSFVDIVICLWRCVITKICNFGLNWRFFNNIVADGFTSSLSLFKISVFLLSRFADVCPRSAFCIKWLYVWRLVNCSLKFHVLFTAFCLVEMLVYFIDICALMWLQSLRPFWFYLNLSLNPVRALLPFSV
jgi:hypothetical protein